MSIEMIWQIIGSLEAKYLDDDLHVALCDVFRHPATNYILSVLILQKALHVTKCCTMGSFEVIRLHVAVTGELVEEACSDLVLATKVEKIILFFLLVPNYIGHLEALLLEKRDNEAFDQENWHSGQVSDDVLEFGNCTLDHELPVFHRYGARLDPSVEERSEVRCDFILIHIIKFRKQSGSDIVNANSFLCAIYLKLTSLKELFDDLENRLLFLLFLFIVSLSIFFTKELLKASLHLGHELIHRDLESLYLSALLSGLSITTPTSVSAAATLASIRGTGHHGCLFLHAGIIVAPIIPAVVTRAVTTAATTALAAFFSTLAGSLATFARSSVLLDNLAADLLFRFYFARVFRALGPSVLLILKHVLNQLLDALCDDS